MAKALKGSVTVEFKQPKLDVSITEPTVILYKGSQKKLREEKTIDVATSSDQDWFSQNIYCRTSCPINTDARSYSLAISKGQNQLAYLIARQNNPFVSVLGKACNAPCEDVCQRAKIDSPVALRALKDFAVERNRFSTQEVYKWLDTKKSKVKLRKGEGPPRVTIIGGGPAGLSAAHDLALMGYKVKVIEATSRLGGMLNATPRYKLDKESIKKDIDNILYLGVEVETNRTCGTDFSIDEALGQYDAVLLATGLQKGKLPDIPGTELQGVLHGVDFLKHVFAGDRVFLGETVLVLGGGNVALDIARTARRVGARNTGIGVVCIEAAKSSKPYNAEDEMSVDSSEIYAAKQEGIAFLNSLAPKEIIGEYGEVKGLKVRHVRTVYDDKGRFDPTFSDTKVEVLKADTVILGFGQELDSLFKEKSKGLGLTADGLLKVHAETMMTTRGGLFSCGDMISPGHIVDAVASGQKAAQSIHEYLGGTGSLGLGSLKEIRPVHHHE
ncbi:MAG: FAD-dependent oxidoreductase, partial [Candidatus Brocadiales bacterium]